MQPAAVLVTVIIFKCSSIITIIFIWVFVGGLRVLTADAFVNILVYLTAKGGKQLGNLC